MKQKKHILTHHQFQQPELFKPDRNPTEPASGGIEPGHDVLSFVPENLLILFSDPETV